MLFTPLLPEAASGTLEPRHVVVPLRLMCRRADLVLGRVTGLDAERRVVSVEALDGPIEIGYERLVLGARLGFPRTTRAWARRARARLPRPRRRDRAAQPHPAAARGGRRAATEEARARHLAFVFVGAGYAGVEALAELADLVRDALRFYPGLRDTQQRWVLVDAAPKILPRQPHASSSATRCSMRCRCSCSISTARAGTSAASSRAGAARSPGPTGRPTAAPAARRRVRPPASTTELHAQAEAFVATLAERLARGAAFFIDYGFPEAEYYHPQRSGGTLMCHRAHRADTDPLADVGAEGHHRARRFQRHRARRRRRPASTSSATRRRRASCINCGFVDLLAGAELGPPRDAQKLVDEHEMGELFKVHRASRRAASSSRSASPAATGATRCKHRHEIRGLCR